MMKVRDSVRAAVDEAQFAKVLSTILRSGDAIPLLLSLPPTSIRPFKNFVNMAFALRRRPVYGSLVKITLKPVSNNGNEYSVASFTKVRDFAGEELAGIGRTSARWSRRRWSSATWNPLVPRPPVPNLTRVIQEKTCQGGFHQNKIPLNR